jgi:hypothetical protein
MALSTGWKVGIGVGVAGVLAWIIAAASTKKAVAATPLAGTATPPPPPPVVQTPGADLFGTFTPPASATADTPAQTAPQDQMNQTQQSAPQQTITQTQSTPQQTLTQTQNSPQQTAVQQNQYNPPQQQMQTKVSGNLSMGGMTLAKKLAGQP